MDNNFSCDNCGESINIVCSRCHSTITILKSKAFSSMFLVEPCKNCEEVERLNKLEEEKDN